MATPIGFLDTRTCMQDGQETVPLEVSPVLNVPLPECGVLFYDFDGSARYLDRDGLSNLMSCTFLGHLLLEQECLLADRHLWSFPPPVSASTPFGPIPSSERLGCEELLRTGSFMYEEICVKRIGVVDGVDVGLGLFTTAGIPEGSFIGEYTGCMMHRRSEEDGEYGFSLPIIDPDFVINARHYGNLCRLVNHSDTGWNSEVVVVHHEGLLHAVLRAARKIEAGEQILMNYGAHYWLPESRRCVNVQLGLECEPPTIHSPKSICSAWPASDAKAPSFGTDGYGRLTGCMAPAPGYGCGPLPPAELSS